MCLKNIRFFKDGILLVLDHNNPQCKFADSIAIISKFQKKDERYDAVTQKGMNDALMSPVKIWYQIVLKE